MNCKWKIHKKIFRPHLDGHIGHCWHLADLYFGINKNIRVGQKK